MTTRAKKSGPSRALSAGPTREPATEKDVQVRVFKGHEGVIHRVAITEDGNSALTSGHDGTVRRWELGGNKGESQIVLRGDHFFGLSMTADGNVGAASDDSGNIFVFGIDPPTEPLRIKLDRGPGPAGDRVERIDLTNADQLLRTSRTRSRLGGTDLAFAVGDRELLSATSDGNLRRWDVRTGACLAQWQLISKGDQCGVAASVDGHRMVGVVHGEGLAIWSGTNDETVNLLKEPIDPNVPISLPRDDRFAFTGTLDNKVAKWNIAEGRRIAVFEGHSGPVRAVAVTPDGRFCISGDVGGVIRLWAAETGQCLAILRVHYILRKDMGSREGKPVREHRDSILWINGLALTPDARRVASVGNDGTLRVWDIHESILARASALQKRGYMNAKVVLLGDSGVGKTGLALRLWHDRWKKTESTHGMEIQRLVLPQGDGEPGVEREVWLWDLAGQPDYRLTHQLFMEQTSLALLVFDPQELDVFGTVGYWQSALRKVANADNMAGILVAARCDRPGLRLTMDEVHGWAAARGLHGPILTAAKLKRHPGAAELRALITKLLP